jgi:hypothetical protein
MKKIKIIPAIGLIKKLKGLGVLNFAFIGITHFSFVFLLVLIPLTLFGLIETNQILKLDFIVTIILLLLFSFWGLRYFYLSKIYIPGKSFFIERLNKQKVKILLIIIFAINITLELNHYRIHGSLNIPYLVVFIVIYYYLKSLKVHADIDYTTNEYLTELIGIDVDEKIKASYQNFDSTKKIKKDNNLIIVTTRKIYFANYNGKNWETMTKLLSDINKIGIARNDADSYLKLIFSDETSLGLRLELDEKITTTPQLFLKQFLSTLDDSLLGVQSPSGNSRRRVSISNENKIVAGNSGNLSRIIELNPILINELKSSEEIKSGRNLEI